MRVVKGVIVSLSLFSLSAFAQTEEEGSFLITKSIRSSQYEKVVSILESNGVKGETIHSGFFSINADSVDCLVTGIAPKLVRDCSVSSASGKVQTSAQDAIELTGILRESFVLNDSTSVKVSAKNVTCHKFRNKQRCTFDVEAKGIKHSLLKEESDFLNVFFKQVGLFDDGDGDSKYGTIRYKIHGFTTSFNFYFGGQKVKLTNSEINHIANIFDRVQPTVEHTGAERIRIEVVFKVTKDKEDQFTWSLFFKPKSY
jgi:hypothetical protein